MPEIALGNNTLTVEFEANASISDGEVLYMSGNDLVSPASDTEIQATVGVSHAAANSGEKLPVVIMGKKQVTADGAINPGEPVVPSATAGRVVSELGNPASHHHTMGTHSHTALNVDTDASHEAAEDRTSFVAVADGGGTFPTADIDMAAAGSASSDTPLSTSSDNPGNTSTQDPSPDNARSLGIAVGSASAAGDAVTVLVGAKSG